MDRDGRPFAAQPPWQSGGAPPTDGQPPPPGGRVPSDLPADIRTILQMGTDALLAEVLKELREQSQAGYAWGSSVLVNSAVPLEELFNPPLFSISLTNDGPNTVQYRLPNIGGAPWINLQMTEVITFSFNKARVISIAFRATGGNSATVRMVGAR